MHLLHMAKLQDSTTQLNWTFISCFLFVLMVFYFRFCSTGVPAQEAKHMNKNDLQATGIFTLRTFFRWTCSHVILIVALRTPWNTLKGVVSLACFEIVRACKQIAIFMLMHTHRNKRLYSSPLLRGRGSDGPALLGYKQDANFFFFLHFVQRCDPAWARFPCFHFSRNRKFGATYST